MPRKSKAAKVKEVVADDGASSSGPSVEVVLSVCTGVLLLAAWLMLDYEKGRSYGEGAFFKNEYGTTE